MGLGKIDAVAVSTFAGLAGSEAEIVGEDRGEQLAGFKRFKDRPSRRGADNSFFLGRLHLDLASSHHMSLSWRHSKDGTEQAPA